MTFKAVIGFVAMVVLVLCSAARAQTIQGTPDDTAGVFLFSAGGSSGTCQDPQGVPAAQPTDDIVSAAIGFDLLELVGDQAEEVDQFTPGIPEGASSVDSTIAKVTEGLGAIDDFGVIGGSQDDAANFDAGRGGSVTVGLRAISGVRGALVVQPDGVSATGILGPSGASSPQDADGALDGFEIFVFEDAELSGMSIHLTSPTNDITISLADRQVDPKTKSGADDTLIAIDLDTLAGFDGTYIDTITIVDDGVVMSSSPCPTFGETSMEIDAIAVRAAAIVVAPTPTQTPTASDTPTLTPTPTQTPPAIETPTASPTPTSTDTPEPTVVVADTETPVPTPTDTPTPTVTNTPSPTRTPIIPDGSLVVSKAKLKMAHSRNNGKAIVAFLVNDNDTNGDFKASLMAGLLQVEVRDGGTFEAVITVSGCVEKGSGIIRCKSDDKTVSAVFRPDDLAPNHFEARVKVRKLSAGKAGETQPVGPVDVNLIQSEIARADEIANCSPSGRRTLRCREK